MIYHESVTGMFEDDGNLAEFNMMQLNRALEQTLQIYNACFICFNGNTFGVIAIMFVIHIPEMIMVGKCKMEGAY